MTVYVMRMRYSSGQVATCHLSADTPAELRDAAFRLGIQSNRVRRESCEIHPGQLIQALQNGAVEITMVQYAQMRFCRQRTKQPCTPEQAREFHLAYVRQKQDRAARKGRRAA